MNAVRRMPALLAALALVMPATAAAQGAKCAINEKSPFQIAGARNYLTRATGGGKEDEKPKHLKNAVQVLTEKADKINNQVGRNWLLARTLYAWLERPGMGQVTIVPRGTLGYTEQPNESIDVVAAIDTALTFVEKAAPECEAETRVYRQNLFARVFNPSIELFNSNATDSAAVLINRSLTIYRNSPLAYNLLASIALRRNDAKAALANYQRVVEIAGTDTIYAKLKRTAMNNMGVLALQMAEEASGEARSALLKQSADYFRSYLALVPTDPAAQQGLTRALSLSGDTASLGGIYAAMVAQPEKYSDIQLFEAGSNAAIAKRYGDAAKLLAAGLSANPYYRDALFNLANVYLEQEKADEMLPYVRRLVEVDPNNPDNWRLLAGAYQLKGKSTKDAGMKRKMTDSLVKFLMLSTKATTRVSFSSFQHDGALHTLAGSIENLGAAAVTYQLKVDFLDKTGAVVASQTASVGPVAPKATQPFTVKVQQAGVVAFRYAALP